MIFSNSGALAGLMHRPMMSRQRSGFLQPA